MLGRASAHVGIRSRQGLIPSALAINLSGLPVSSTGDAKHDGEGGPAKKRPLRHLSRPGALLSNRPLPAPRRDGHHRGAARAGGDRHRVPRRRHPHRSPARRSGATMRNIEQAATARPLVTHSPGARTPTSLGSSAMNGAPSASNLASWPFNPRASRTLTRAAREGLCRSVHSGPVYSLWARLFILDPIMVITPFYGRDRPERAPWLRGPSSEGRCASSARHHVPTHAAPVPQHPNARR
jgi:hypothetical protein